LEIAGQSADVSAFMPLILINPQIQPFGQPASGPEGCLSFPEIYADIVRPESVQVQALNPKGQPIEFKAGGLLARAVQHEVDHLNGILFIDRMASTEKSALKPELDALQSATKSALKKR
jgi:peptide deformylase